MAAATTRTRSPMPTRGSRSIRVVIAADRLIHRFARHWRLVVNVLALPPAVLPLASAWLKAAGIDATARPIEPFFGALCHQRADRSVHLDDERTSCCHRCFAIYGGLFLAGLLFVHLRSIQPEVRPLRPLWVALLCVPIVVDGLAQLGGAWESTWYLRTSSGLLFATAVSWFLLPFSERGFARMRSDVERLLDRLVVQGRTRPLTGLTQEQVLSALRARHASFSRLRSQ